MIPIAINRATNDTIVNTVSDFKKNFFAESCTVSGKSRNIIPFINVSHPKIGIKMNQPPFNFQ